VTLLRLQSVRRSFWRGPSEIEVLKDVSLEIEPGELFAVYGQRNGGKTTLLKVAGGFESPDAGQVVFDGDDLARLSRRELALLHREQISWVERAGPHSRDLAASVYVGLPLYDRVGPAKAQRRALTALTKVGARDCADQRWTDLSDTERMLVAIAHALAREPKLMIVDDPTAGLGIIDRERVAGLLRSAAEEGGIGVLMAVPDMPSMMHATTIRLLSRGRLIAPALPPGSGTNVVEFPHHKRV